MADVEAGELRRFLLEDQPVRGHWVRLGPAWLELRTRRAYPALVEALLGEAASAAVLLAATLKFEGTLTLQLAGDGRVGLLVAQCTDDFHLRATANHDLNDTDVASFPELVGSGRLVVTVQSDTSSASYQGIVPLEGASLSECLESYFENSEQLPTRLLLGADRERAGGLLLQKLPSAGGVAGGEGAGARLQGAWEDLQAGLQTLPVDLLLGGPAEDVVRRVFGVHDCRLFPHTAVRFRCRCSPERVASLVRSLGHEEAQAALAEQGALTVTCEFCGRDYRYDAIDVGQLFAADGSLQRSPGTVN